MKKVAIAVAGVAAMMAIPAVAGINPFDPGLPQGWNSAEYGVAIGDNVAPPLLNGAAATARLTVLDSYSSAMCVACHERNPSDKITNPSQTGMAITKATHQGSHFVVGAALATNSGGGFTGGATVTRAGAALLRPRVAGEYEKTSPWAPSAQAGKGLSKYGANIVTFQDNDILTGAAASAIGNITCESCHNILVNRGDQLLLGAYGNTSADVQDSGGANALPADQICVACHGKGAETYAAFHDNGNLRNFNGAELKRHHVLSGLGAANADVVAAANYDPDGVASTNDSIMWAPNYTRELGPVAAPWVRNLTVADGAVYEFRARVNATGQGTYAQAIATGDIPTTTQLMCVSCHRPHNAETTAGAFILRRGTLADGFVNGNAVTGIERQSDWDTDYSTKIYGDYVPLCKGCHQGYGN